MAAMACISLATLPRSSKARVFAAAGRGGSIASASTATCGRRQALALLALASSTAFGSNSKAAFSLDSPVAAAAEEGSSPFETYYGTAASASSYGGYGGNASKKDSAEYIFEVPQGWKERLISKVEKGTNGTDSEFYNPRRKGEKTYLTYLAGFRKLANRDNVLNDLSLSDVSLQDDISQADSIKASDKQNDSGQLYYEYEIQGPVAHSLIFVTCAKNKLYAHYVRAPTQDWTRDEPMLRHVHESFMTVGA
ncbi:thylakoid lumenal 19 kDa protein, chloroplastic [Selaginella moellendorffii]|nr:thylakoid lumenal 19 kDa protein, chloroplastic [Selaginella moellendorffii]XP_002993114.2 thylakoid lumenal 19 kDa protein, chloroplastic [Selaginella moellendorffii]|eukprot:XP_002964554.2 thylakoid lumenal 19 kDa protein, chloroplastic [Selaginella moellendorffii]